MVRSHQNQNSCTYACLINPSYLHTFIVINQCDYKKVSGINAAACKNAADENTAGWKILIIGSGRNHQINSFQMVTVAKPLKISPCPKANKKEV